MKNVCWVLFGVSVVLFLIGVYSKFVGLGSFVMGYAPVGWWRAAMALVIYAMALKMLAGNAKA
jgi:hypothetical protein